MATGRQLGKKYKLKGGLVTYSLKADEYFTTLEFKINIFNYYKMAAKNACLEFTLTKELPIRYFTRNIFEYCSDISINIAMPYILNGYIHLLQRAP